MSLTERSLYRETLAAAFAFHARKLWLEYEHDECFALVVPGEEHPMFACTMGQRGQEFGLVVFRGPAAAASLLNLVQRDARDVDIPDEAAFMGFSMTRYEDAPPAGRSFLAKAGFAGRRADEVPFFIAKDAGRDPRKVTLKEAGSLLYVLKGTLKARDAGMLVPRPLRAGEETLTLIVSGDPLDPEVTTEFRRLASQRPPSVAPLSQLRAELRDLPRIPNRWLIGCPVMPVSIGTDDRTVRMVLVVDEGSVMIVVGRPAQGGIPEAVELVCGAFRGENELKVRGIPAEVLIANQELFHALSPVLDSLGVRCRYEPAMPLLNAVLQGFVRHLEGGEHEPEDGEGEMESVPRPDDLEEWKRCDASLYLRAQARLRDIPASADKALARYFGSADAGDRFLGNPDDPFASMCFFEWFWQDYRRKEKSQTLAEKMLSEELPKPQGLLLEARIRATPSIYKVERIERGISLTLLDVLFGGEVVLHDKSLSQSAMPDISFPARVFPAGSFHFGAPLGPPLSAMDTDAALEFLKRQGLKLTRDGVKDGSHLFGRLWQWAEKERAQRAMPHMANTDGDDLCFHTATYAVQDEAQARAALAARQDVEHDPEEGDYRWFRANDPATSILPGDSISLGNLSFVGDELLVEVNSAERLRKARAWLDQIPGIQFKSLRVQTLDEAMKAGTPPDAKLGRQEAPMTPELREHVQQVMHQHYMRWLDTPLPMFGGKTPRQMCRTPEGRRQVARLIRTTPKPMGPAGPDVDVPRKEMFDALGLNEND